MVTPPAVPEGSGEPETWTCPTCGEVLERRFEACWKCAEASEPPAGLPPGRKPLLGYLLFTFRVLSVAAFIFFGCAAFVRHGRLYAAAALFLFGVCMSLLFAILMRFDEQQPETWLLGVLSWLLGTLLSPGPLALLSFVSAGLLAMFTVLAVVVDRSFSAAVFVAGVACLGLLGAGLYFDRRRARPTPVNGDTEQGRRG